MGLSYPNDSPEPSAGSQTAQDYIASQLSLEADAREALPYQFDTCTKPLGPLRQSVYACLTCTPPPASPHQQYTPAGVCYSCSISCHGEHNLVELFCKRNFVCDCGTKRFENSGHPCSLRFNEQTGRKGGVIGEEAHTGNEYNQNFQGRFCGCGEEYDPHLEKGTMYQCIGLGTGKDGGCGEDWWHPECLLRLPRTRSNVLPKPVSTTELQAMKEEAEVPAEVAQEHSSDQKADNEEDSTPPGFPDEDDFDCLICYKCADAFPWVKQYAGTKGFLPAVSAQMVPETTNGSTSTTEIASSSETKKRKAEDDVEDNQDTKRSKTEDQQLPPALATASSDSKDLPKHASLPATPLESINLFVFDDFREQFCRCATCFPRLAQHPQLLEEEEAYEPPVSESDHNERHENGSVAGRSVNSGSLLDRGEAALSSMDRVRAIEGVMAYNHVRDKVKAFLKPFAESGTPVGAEDIKAYFAKLRGDDQGNVKTDTIDGDSSGPAASDSRKEQDGY